MLTLVAVVLSCLCVDKSTQITIVVMVGNARVLVDACHPREHRRIRTTQLFTPLLACLLHFEFTAA